MSLEGKLYHGDHCNQLVKLIIGKAAQLFGRNPESVNSANQNSLVQWFDELKKRIKTESDDPLEVKARNARILLIPSLFGLLRDTFLTQRWEEGLKILIHLADIPEGASVTVWKAGLQLLFSEPEKNENDIINLIGQMKLLSELNAKEVVLEYVFLLLLDGKIENTKYFFQSIPRTKSSEKQKTERAIYVDTLFEAYEGLVWYVEWCRAKRNMEDMSKIMEDADFTSSNWTSTDHDQVTKSLAIKASKHFSNIFEQLGVWDIFITKQIEILEFLDREDEARHILEQYRNRNPENPNAQKYLYQFSVRHGIEREKQIELLKEISLCVPADSMVLELVEILWNGAQNPIAVCHLFNILDHNCWRFHVRPWKMMATILEQIYLSGFENLLDSLKSCWEVRATWWPSYHFCVSVINQQEEISVQYQKAIAALFLLGHDNAYSMTVRESLDEREQGKINECVMLCVRTEV